jgi:hypothetical protein
MGTRFWWWNSVLVEGEGLVRRRRKRRGSWGGSQPLEATLEAAGVDKAML